MVCTTFYNVITDAAFKQQYTRALDNIIEEQELEKTSGLSPTWYHCYQIRDTHRLKNNDSRRRYRAYSTPTKKKQKKKQHDTFLTYCSGMTEL